MSWDAHYFGFVSHPKREKTDAEIKAMSPDQRFDLMSECDYEPADPKVCDACAAYMISQELDD